MGRASNRKKARRQAAYKTQRAGQSSRAGTAPQQAMLPLVAGLQALNQDLGARGEQQAPAYRAWCGGREPVPAEGPRWAEGSLRDRLFSGTHLARARNARSEEHTSELQSRPHLVCRLL